MQVEGHRDCGLPQLPATGARVRNAYRTCPLLRDSLAKASLIPDVLNSAPAVLSKDLSVMDGDASD